MKNIQALFKLKATHTFLKKAAKPSCLKRMNLFFITLLVSIGVFASTTVDFKLANQKAAESIFDIYSNCPDRIWNGYNLKDLDILFVDEEQEELFEVSLAENRVSIRNKSEFNKSFLSSSFSFFKQDGKSFMSINVRSFLAGVDFSKQNTEKVFERAFRLALHEAFHGTLQTKWIKKKRGPRGTFVPIQAEPRLYRSMIYKRLLEAIANDSQESLGKAKYWYNKWKIEFPHEVLSSMDRTEGSARFVDDRAWALWAAGGCSATEASIQKKHAEIIANKNDPSLDGRYFSLDSEAYTLGSAALAAVGIEKNQKIYEEVAQGESPLSAAFARISVVTDEADKATYLKFIETQKEQARTADEMLSKTYETLNSQEMLIISVPQEWFRFGDIESSIGYEGFFLDFQKSVQFSVYSEQIESGSPDRSSVLPASAGAVGVQFNNADIPCDSPFEFYVVKRSDLKIISGNQYEISNANLKGSFSASEKNAATGQTFLCLGQ